MDDWKLMTTALVRLRRQQNTFVEFLCFLNILQPLLYAVDIAVANICRKYCNVLAEGAKFPVFALYRHRMD